MKVIVDGTCLPMPAWRHSELVGRPGPGEVCCLQGRPVWHSPSRPGRVREAVAIQAMELQLHLESHTQETPISAPLGSATDGGIRVTGTAAGTVPQTESQDYGAPRGPSQSGLQLAA